MIKDLQATATALVVRGKGILAADETVPTLTRRFDALGRDCNERPAQPFAKAPGSTMTRVAKTALRAPEPRRR